MNNVNNNVNFTARLDISKVEKDKIRWRKIAKLFEEKTTNRPNDVFHIHSYSHPQYGKWTEIDSAGALSDNTGAIEARFSEKLYGKLMNLSDERVAGKLRRLLDISTKWRRTERNTYKLMDKFADDFTVVDPLCEAMHAQKHIDLERIVEKDSLLKKAEIC